MSRSSLVAALTASLLAFIIYSYTLAPSVTWKHSGADSGDLATAAFTLGIPHPPGYPLFTLIASLFARIPFLEPAGGVGVLAAAAAAAAVFFLARAAASLSPGKMGGLLGVLVALGFAFSSALWSQATIAQAYTLDLFFACVILWAMISDHPQRISFAAIALGLGLAHHLSILLLLPGSLLALRPSRRDWRAALFVLAPLLVYAYLPLRALAAPPVNWGDPRTPDRFLWVVTAGPYLSSLFGITSVDIAARIESLVILLAGQFTWPALVLALWGLVRLAFHKPRLASALELNAALTGGYAVLFATRDLYIYLLPFLAVVSLWMAFGAADLALLIRSRFERGAGEESGGQKAGRASRLAAGFVTLLVILGFVALPTFNVMSNFGAMDLASDREAFNYARSVFDQVPPDAIVFAEGDQAVFALTYYRQAFAYETLHGVVVSQGLLQYPWYYENLRTAMNEVTFAPPDVKSDFHQRAVEIVGVTFAEGRSVCFTQSSPLLPEFDYEPHGDLKCVVSQK